MITLEARDKELFSFITLSEENWTSSRYMLIRQWVKNLL